MEAEQSSSTLVSLYTMFSGRRRNSNSIVLDKLLEDGAIQTNEALIKLLADTIEGNGRFHLIGCIGDEDIAYKTCLILKYSKIRCLKELVSAAKVAGVSEVYIHGITGNTSSHENS